MSNRAGLLCCADSLHNADPAQSAVAENRDKEHHQEDDGGAEDNRRDSKLPGEEKEVGAYRTQRCNA